MLDASTAIFLARAMVLPWVMPEHIRLIPIRVRWRIPPWSPRRSSRKLTVVVTGALGVAQRSAKRLGGHSVSEVSELATRSGVSSTRWVSVPSAKQQLKPMACDLSQVVDCSACRASGCARCERQPSRLEMKKLVLTGIAVLLAISAAYAADDSQTADYFGGAGGNYPMPPAVRAKILRNLERAKALHECRAYGFCGQQRRR